jgi:WD40 repeat protein
VGTPALRLHLSQGKQVQCVSLSPDGNRLAAGSEDGIVRICSVATGGDAGTNVMMFSAVLAVRFSPDGERVVAVEKSGQARVWNAASGQAVTPPFQPEDFNPTSIGEVGSWLKPSVEFSPDGRFFLLSFGSNSAELRDAADGKLLRRFTHGKVVYHATFSPDTQWVVTSSKDTTACVWETATGKLAAPPLQHSDIVTRAQFSSDAQKLMTVRNRHFVQLWDWRTGERLGKELPRRSELSHASLSPDDRKVLTTAWSGFAHLYDAASSLIINEFVHEGGLVDAAFSPDGHYAAIACHDGNVWLWDVYDRRRRPMLLPQGNQIEQISFNHDGRFLAVGTRGGHARVWELFPPERGVQRLSGKDVQWVEFDSSGNRALILSTGEQSAWSNYDVQSGQLMSTAALSPSDARCVRFSPDGKRILAYGSGRRVLVFDSATGRQTVKPLGHSQRVTDALWSADGKLIVTVAGAARAWNPDTGQTAVTFAHSNSVRAIALSADGARLATGHADKSVVLWRTANGEREGFPLTGFGSIRELHFTPDGRRLGIATSGQSGEGIVEVRELASGKVIGAPLQHRDAVTSFAFSPNGKMIATGCNDHSVRVWDVATGEPISPWLRHDFEARLVVFSPDGTRLATIARRGAVRLWSTRTGEPITAPIVYLRNTGNGHVSYSPDGRRLLLSRGGNEAFLRDLQPEAAGVEELRLLSEVLTCTRFDPAAGMVPLDEVALNDAWKQLRILRAGN